MTDDNKLIPPADNDKKPEVIAPEARKRGRPPGSGKATAAPVSPDDKPNEAKSGPKPRKGKVKFDSEAQGQLAKQIEGLHQLMALATGIPELQVQTAEAQMLGTAVAAVCEEYDLSLSGKTGAMLQLLAAAAMVYAPRVAVIGRRVKENQARAKADHLRVVAGTDHADTPHT